MTRRYLFRRCLEILPGALVWITLIASVSLSFVRPLWVIYFIIVFDLYWLFRVAYYLPFVFVSWLRYRRSMKRDWQAQAEALPGYDRVRHLVFLPTVKEDVSVVRETLKVLASGTYPAERMLVVLAGEGRAGEHFSQVAETVKNEFSGTFGRLFIEVHPVGLPDEIVGKGANLNHAGHRIAKEIEALGLDPADVIVSAFDVDTIVHPKYFSNLTYLYLTVPEPTRSSFQPFALYNNNLWESPAAVRVAMFGTTFWLLTELSRPEGMMTFPRTA